MEMEIWKCTVRDWSNSISYLGTYFKDPKQLLKWPLWSDCFLSSQKKYPVLLTEQKATRKNYPISNTLKALCAYQPTRSTGISHTTTLTFKSKLSVAPAEILIWMTIFEWHTETRSLYLTFRNSVVLLVNKYERYSNKPYTV